MPDTTPQLRPRPRPRGDDELPRFQFLIPLGLAVAVVALTAMTTWGIYGRWHAAELAELAERADAPLGRALYCPDPEDAE